MSSLLLKLQILSDQKFWQRVLHSRWGLALSSIALGLIATLGFAPFNMWVVAIVSLAFEFCLVASLKRRRQVFFSTLLYFTALNTITLEWLNFVMVDFGDLPFAVSLLIETLFSCYLAIIHATLATVAYRYAMQKYQPPKEAEPDSNQEDDEESVEMADSSLVGSFIPHGLSQNYLFPIITKASGAQFRFFKNAFLLCFLPVALIIADFIIGVLFTGFPWMYFGYTALEGPFSAYAPLMGVRGISLVLFISAGALALAIERRYIYLPVAGVLFLFGIFMLGVQYTSPLKPINVMGIQGNIPQAIKWDPHQTKPSIDKYINLSLEHFGNNDLIVWPESAMPVYFQQIIPLIKDLNRHGYQTGTALAIGMQRFTVDKHSFNSMFLLGQDASLNNIQAYDKRQLVPFGEVVPFAEYTRQLGSIFNFPMSSFTHGSYYQKQMHLVKRDLYFIPALCYESIFPELMTSLHDEKTNGILMISNDSWYGDTRGPQEHLAIAQMRSLEMQKPMIRVTNSGITAYINAQGEVVKRLPSNVDGALQMAVVPTKGMTPFVRFGNIPLYLIMLLLIGIGFYLRSQNQDERLAQLKEMIRP